MFAKNSFLDLPSSNFFPKPQGLVRMISLSYEMLLNDEMSYFFVNYTQTCLEREADAPSCDVLTN